MPDVQSLTPAEVGIARILASSLWALQTRSWRRSELHQIQTARIIATNRASRIGRIKRPSMNHIRFIGLKNFPDRLSSLVPTGAFFFGTTFLKIRRSQSVTRLFRTEKPS